MTTVLTRTQIDRGIEQFTIDLGELYSKSEGRDSFEERWIDFYKSDKDNPQIFKRSNNTLIYLSESIIPRKTDSRPSLLLLFGNPATHSVVSKMYFSYEAGLREHRVWRIFKEVDLVNFEEPIPENFKSLLELNQINKRKLYDLDYNSSFRIGFAVYISMPSTATKPPWSGVAGVRRLFGANAFKIIEMEEQARIKSILLNFIQNRGGVIAFQKDAYNAVRGKNSPPYNLKYSLISPLSGSCKFNNAIPLLGVPPTRFLLGKTAKETLKKGVALLKDSFQQSSTIID